MGTYREIKSLVKDLRESKVKNRRAAGDKLQLLLSQSEVRKKLAAEVFIPSGGSRSMLRTRMLALSEFWRYIIQSAISSVQFISDGKSKLTDCDILLPYNLIRLCDLCDDGNDATIKLSSPKLDKQTTRMVFEYCMDMLDNKLTLDLAELPLLQMMSYMCSRGEYVAHFKPTGEINAIIEIVKIRILSEDGSLPHAVVLEASKIFENVIKTSLELGIGLEVLSSDCIKLVASWCNSTRSNAIVSELPHVMNALSILIDSNPEQCIVPMSRFGQSILSFAKVQYKNTLHQPSLNKYFLSHL